MIYIGFDPGIKGAVGIVDDDGYLQDCFPFPSFKELSRKGRKISRPDIVKLKDLFEKIGRSSETKIMVEKQVAMPGQNAVGTFNTGKGYGILQTFITIYFPGIEVEYIGCKEWQSEMIPIRTPVASKIRRHKRKQLKLDSIAHAKELFPLFDFRATAKSKVDSDGLSDAALIAAYCYNKNK